MSTAEPTSLPKATPRNERIGCASATWGECDTSNGLRNSSISTSSMNSWREMLHRAREVAESGQKEAMLLRFAKQLCIDDGRAINVAEADWPATLRGEAAEIYLRWERDLKHNGFSLSARVLEFPDGKPGDIGLFLGWGK